MSDRARNAVQTLTPTEHAGTVAVPAYFREVRSRATGLKSFYFEVPTWARRQDCPVRSCPLGHDLETAVEHGTRMVAELHEWMSGRDAVEVASGPLPGSLEASVEIYKGHRHYRDICDGTRRVYDKDLRTLTAHAFRSGPLAGIPLGRLPWRAITPQLVDALIDDLLVRIVHVDGVPRAVASPRRARSVVSTAATMWSVAVIAGGIPTTVNPFKGHRIKRATKETTAATADQVCDVVKEADAIGHRTLGTILLSVFEFVWRPEHVVQHFMVEHYRPPEEPDGILITDSKNGTKRWRPLFDYADQPQYGALSTRLDALKGDRTSGAMFARNGDAGAPPPSMVTVRTWLNEAVARTPHKGLTLASFRHGGLTECGEAGLTELEIRRLSLHKTTAVLGRYVHGTSVGQEISQAKRVELRNGRRASTRGTRFLAGGFEGQDASARPGGGDRTLEE